MLGSLLRDFRYALRTLARNPGFAFVSVLALALGIGANTAIFTVVNSVLLQPLPYTHPEQIVHLWEMSDEGHRMNFADPNFTDMQSQNHSLQGIAEYASSLESVSGGKEPSRTMVASVSRDFFAVMGVHPAIGRGFAAEEGRRVSGVSKEALELLTSYSWPGNVRQLENAMFRAVVLADGP